MSEKANSAKKQAKAAKKAEAIRKAQRKEKMKKLLPLFCVLAVAVIAAAAVLIKKNADRKKREASYGIYADIVIKNYGTITVKLDPESAPITVDNFVSLAESGFYDGLTFHRIMENFMMQGGDPEGNGFGGSEKKIKGEFSANGVENPLSHTRGAISMARPGNDMDGASSQFFICQRDVGGSLDGQYACFGYVTEGMDIVDRICADARPTDNNGTIPAAEQPVMETIKIRRVGDAG